MNVSVAERALQLRLEDAGRVIKDMQLEIRRLAGLLRQRNELLYDIKSLIVAKGINADSIVDGTGWDDYSRMGHHQRERMNSYGTEVYEYNHPEQEQNK